MAVNPKFRELAKGLFKDRKNNLSFESETIRYKKSQKMFIG
jgi:hypothetical protein